MWLCQASLHGYYIFFSFFFFFLKLFLCGTAKLCSHLLLLDAFVNRGSGVLGLAMGCSNTFGLVTGAFLLGFGLSEIPKSIWKNADWTTRQKVLSHKIAKMAVKLDDAHQELSNAIVVSLLFFPYKNSPVILSFLFSSLFPFLLLPILYLFIFIVNRNFIEKKKKKKKKHIVLMMMNTLYLKQLQITLEEKNYRL